jgi:hypothetical protein
MLPMKIVRAPFVVVAVAAVACANVVVVDDGASGGTGGSTAAVSATQSASASGSQSTSSVRADSLAICGNGVLEPGEECDDGGANECGLNPEVCTCKCRIPRCGDGVQQYGEGCDAGSNNGAAGSCSVNCECNVCSKAKIFKAAVVSAENPADKVGPGLPGSWAYKGFTGIQAGKALCQDVGADHVCGFREVLAAEAKGELAAIPMNHTYWLRRISSAPDAYHPNTPCKANNECHGSNDTELCNHAEHRCAWISSADARCNDWTSIDDGYDGEWFERYDPSSAFAAGGVHIGGLSYHFDANVAEACHDPTKLGCAGPCAGVMRAILCCFPTCCPSYSW